MQTMTIEELLRWAFVLEVAGDGERLTSAVTGSSWDLVARVGELGTLVDTCGGGSAVLGFSAPPHPDAEVVASAVADLDGRAVAEGEDHDLLAGWPALGRPGERAVARAWEIVSYERNGGRVLRSSLAARVRAVGILGCWPAWQGEAPRVVTELRAGKPAWYRTVERPVRWVGEEPVAWEAVEVDGFDRRAQRPYPGAYLRQMLSPDPAALLASRIEYQLVHAAMRSLAETLDGLGGRRILGPQRLATPWAATGDDARVAGEGRGIDVVGKESIEFEVAGGCT